MSIYKQKVLKWIKKTIFMKEKYEDLRKTHELPEFENLDSDFELYEIDEDDALSEQIREILKKVYDKVDSYAKFLEDLMQPDSRLSLMREASTLTQQDRATITKLHKQCMFITRELIELNLDYSQDRAIEIINKNYVKWQELKLEIKKIVVKLKESWMKDIKLEEDKGYFG